MIRCWDRADFMPNFIIHSFNNVSADESRRRHVACLPRLLCDLGGGEGWGGERMGRGGERGAVLKNY